MRKPQIRPTRQGKVIIEQAADDTILMMFPDGQVCEVSSAEEASKRAHQWFRKNLPAEFNAGVGEIEWRGMEPPK